VHRTSFASTVILAFAALSSTASPAGAEERTHDGFQFRGAVGFGYLSDAESNDGTLHGGAGVLEIYLGGMPVRGLAIGGFLSGASAVGPSITVNGFSASDSNTSLTLVTVGPYIDYYPEPRKGFHILGTLGYANVKASFDDGTLSANSSAGGPTIGVGIGYDWWVGRDWSIGILGRFTYAQTSRTIEGLHTSEQTVLPALLFSVSYN
jgi:hypothetical protein